MPKQIDRCAESSLAYLKQTSRVGGNAVRFYRAIIGPYVVDERGNQIFLGYPEAAIKKDGMFLVNFSAEQRLRGMIPNRNVELDGDEIKPAPGLLVFAHLKEALMWGGDRRYDHELGTPAVGVLEFPLDYFRGRVGIKVFRRYLLHGMEDPRILPAQIVEDVTGGTMETGAYYLQGARSQRVPSSVRAFERLLIPKAFTSSGQIDFKAGFREI